MTERFRPAGTSASERLNVPTECGCCGRTGLKTTVKLVSLEKGSVLWMGSGCAAKAMGMGISEFTKLSKAAQKEVDNAERKAREEATRAENARWFAWLERNAPGIKPSEGREIFDRIMALGGHAEARRLYKEEYGI